MSCVRDVFFVLFDFFFISVIQVAFRKNRDNLRLKLTKNDQFQNLTPEKKLVSLILENILTRDK